MKHRSNYTRVRKPIHGFTLIELLVVISIIALLLSILMPALSKVKQQAMQIVCMSNVKSLTTACMTYSLDNESCLPMSGSRDSDGYMWGQYPYAPYAEVRLLPYLGAKSVSPEYFSSSTGPDIEGDDSKLREFEGTLEVFLCPAIRSTQSSIVKAVYNMGGYPKSYQINTLITGHSVVRSASGKYRIDRNACYKPGSSKITKIRMPARTLLYADTRAAPGSRMNYLWGGWGTRWWSDIRPSHFVKAVGPPDYDNANRSWNNWGLQECRGRSSFGFVDGHVQSLKSQFTEEGISLTLGVSGDDAIQGVKLSDKYNW